MPNEPVPAPPEGQVLIYRDGTSSLQVRIDGQTVWLTQRGMAELYQTSVPNVNQHLSGIYQDGELVPEATVKKYLIVQTEGSHVTPFHPPNLPAKTEPRAGACAKWHRYKEDRVTFATHHQ